MATPNQTFNRVIDELKDYVMTIPVDVEDTVAFLEGLRSHAPQGDALPPHATRLMDMAERILTKVRPTGVDAIPSFLEDISLQAEHGQDNSCLSTVANETINELRRSPNSTVLDALQKGLAESKEALRLAEAELAEYDALCARKGEIEEELRLAKERLARLNENNGEEFAQ